MATVSTAELLELRDLARALLARLDALLEVQQGEERAAARLGQPAGRFNRIP